MEVYRQFPAQPPDAPTIVLYVPPWHNGQSDPEVYEPMGQTLQAAAPPLATEPAAQESCEVLPELGTYLFVTAGVQLWLPVPAAKLPGAQSEQFTWRGSAWKVPAAQLMQLVAPVAFWYDPAAQVPHAATPDAELAVPSAHGVHAWLPPGTPASA